MAAASRPDKLAPGQPYTQDRFGHRHPIAVQTDAGVVELPAGSPTESWTNAQIDAFAQREGIDLSGSKNKTERLAAIDRHREATAPALPSAD